jgi:hypothetical protein
LKYHILGEVVSLQYGAIINNNYLDKGRLWLWQSPIFHIVAIVKFLPFWGDVTISSLAFSLLKRQKQKKKINLILIKEECVLKTTRQKWKLLWCSLLILSNMYTLSTHRLLYINVTKNVRCTLQQMDPARNLKKLKKQVYTWCFIIILHVCT